MAKKRFKQNASPQQPTKKPVTLSEASPSIRTPSWHVGALDVGSSWCFFNLTRDQLDETLGKLKQFERMTWQEIEAKNDSHFIDVGGIIRDAQKRLEAMKLDDTECLYSLRLSGKFRI